MAGAGQQCLCSDEFIISYEIMAGRTLNPFLLAGPSMHIYERIPAADAGMHETVTFMDLELIAAASLRNRGQHCAVAAIYPIYRFVK